MSLLLGGDLKQIAAEFRRIQTHAELAALLEVTPERLYFLAYKKRRGRYRAFRVPKRRGGERIIREPAAGLKVLQQKLNQILQVLYEPRSCVHGFVPGRSIGTNSQVHVGARYVLNIDLKDFFPSINFGRVRGMLLATPYTIAPAVATIVAQICCHDNELPQGAPTSPVLSNMVCSKLDSELVRLARRCRCEYTRYADDLTFSGTSSHPPAVLAFKESWSDHAAPVSLGARLTSVIKDNGFRVNSEKVRVRGQSQRQEVTGLTVNEKPNVAREYIRNLRSVMYDWEKNGPESAERRYLAKDTKARAYHSDAPKLAIILKGKINFLGMVRGKNDPLYRKLLLKYFSLTGGNARPIRMQTVNHLRTWRDAIWVIETDLDLAEESGEDLSNMDGESLAQGTGFFLEEYGFVTCAHVADAPYLVAYQPERPHHRYRATIRSIDRVNDLAILSIPTDAPHEFVASRATVRRGEPVQVLGYPYHEEACTLSATDGHVTAIRGDGTRADRYYLSSAIVSGGSGGPVVDLRGRVIGVAIKGGRFEAEAPHVGRNTAVAVGLLEDIRRVP